MSGQWRAAVAGLLVATGVSTAVIWRIEGGRQFQLRQAAALAAGEYAGLMQRAVETALSPTFALAAMVRQSQGDFKDFETVAAEMLKQYPGTSSLALAPQGVVRRIVPLQGNERALGHDLFADPRRSKEAALARDTGRLTLAGPFPLVQGGVGAAGRYPVYLDGPQGQAQFWGLVVGMVDLPALVKHARLANLPEWGYDYQLWRVHPDSGQRQMIATSVPALAGQLLPDAVHRNFDVHNAQWTLTLLPRPGWMDTQALLLEVLLAALLSLGTAGLSWGFVQLRAKQREVAAQLQGRIEAQAALAQSERRYRVLFQESLDAIVCIGAANTPAAPHTGHRTATMPTAPFTRVNACSPWCPAKPPATRRSSTDWVRD